MKQKELYSLVQLNVKFVRFNQTGSSEYALEDGELQELVNYYYNLKDALEPVMNRETRFGASYALAMKETDDRIRELESWIEARKA